jgi:phosphatidate cytidylyltransferase
MSNFWVRTIWGSLYVLLVIMALIFGGPWGKFGLALIISTFCFVELLNIRKAKQPLNMVFGLTLNLLILLLGQVGPSFLNLTWSLALLLIITYWGIALFRFGVAAIQRVTPVVFALIYISLPCLLFLKITPGWEAPLLVFVLTWSSDTFAYIFGRLFGKRPLYAELSPKKTLEGFAGGVILTGIIGAFSPFFTGITHPAEGFMLGCLVSVAGTAGDLFESALKRDAGIKDSGHFIPGHGGALDRFDAFLFASVVVYSWFISVNPCFLYLSWSNL